MLKLVTFSGYDQHGPHIFPIEADLERSLGHIKMARPLPPEIEQYIRTAKPIPGKTQLLIDAMGSGEYYGSNVNGDYFPDSALSHKGSDYGYQTFMHYAYPYKHHVNKDPARAYGERVRLAAWDPHMHRVLLIVVVDDLKCQDILGDLARNHYWDVSMGCFKAGTMVTMDDGRRKPIEDVEVGELVRTHTGKSKRVTQTHRRQYKGELYAIRAEAHEPVWCTRQHPFLALDHESVKTAGSNSHHRMWRDQITEEPDWIHAECLGSDSFLVEPIPEGIKVSYDGDQRAIARLLGYYLAEGHILRNKKGAACGVEFSTHVDDPIHDEIDDLCERFGTKNPPATSRRPNSEAARTVVVFDEMLARLCLIECGEGSDRKTLGAIRHLADELLLEFLGAYANGDGHGPSDGSLKFSTCNFGLACQVQDALLGLRIPSSLSQLQHKPSTVVLKETTEWVVHVGKQWAQRFNRYCAKIQHSEVIKQKNSRRFYGDQLITPIREIISIYAELDVYNLEVEEDESYLVEGLAVHNCKVPWDECSVCKNRARNRGEYCPHLRYQMNKILPDGRRVFANNWLPKFFDISFVTIGAEKASHVLKKVALAQGQTQFSGAELGESYYAKLSAASKRAQDKNAEIDKEVTSQPPASVQGATTEDQAKLVSFMDDAGDIKNGEKPIPTALLDQLAGLPLNALFSTLAALGIDLRPQEFQRIVLVKQGARPLAQKLAQHRLVFDERQVGKTPAWANGFGSFSATAVSEKIAMLIEPYIAHRSCYPEILLTRLSRMEKSAADPDVELPFIYDRDSQWWPMTDEEKRRASGMQGLVPASVALAGGFLVFRRMFPGLAIKGPEPLRTIARHPWLLPMLIGAGVGASVGLSHMTAPRPLTPHGTGRGVDGKNSPAYHDAKTASVTRLGPIPLAYMCAGIQQRRWHQGDRIKVAHELIAMRPAPLVAGRPLLKTGSAGLDEAIIQTARRIAANKENAHVYSR